jgi:hypothetical protein
MSRAALASFLVLAFYIAGSPLSRAAADAPPPREPGPNLSVLHYAEPVIYTLSLSNDSTANARIATALAHQMNRLYQNPHLFIPAPAGWGLNDFLNQCAQDKSTRGAVLVMPPSIVSGTQGHVLFRTSYSDVGLFAMATNCDQTSNSTVVWRSEFHSNGSTAVTYTFFYPLLAALALYVAIAPTKAYATTTTHPFPAPTKIPSNGYISGVQQQTTTTINGSGTSSITSGLVGSSENYVNNATQVSLTDPVSLNAAVMTLRDVAKDLATYCGKSLDLLGKDPPPVANSWFRASAAPAAAGVAAPALFDPANVCTWGLASN